MKPILFLSLTILLLSSCTTNPNRPCDQTERSGFGLEAVSIHDQEQMDQARSEFETINKCKLGDEK